MTEPNIIIACDVHAHLIPVEASELVGLPGIDWDPASWRMTIDGHVLGMASLFQPEKLLAWMDKHHVAHALISVPPPAYREGLDEARSQGWCNYLNTGLQAIAGAHPNRLTALVHLPVHLPALAAEIAVAAVARGTRGFAMPTGAPDVQIADAAFKPLWQVLSDAEAFVFMHPGSCADGRLNSFYMSNLVGNPHESGIAISSLVLGGVLEHYPGIQFCFAHGGGSAALLAARLQRGYDTARPAVDTTLSGPDRMLPRILVDCITHSEAAVILAEQVFGQDSIVFGSDWPFPMGLTEPGEQLKDFDAERRGRICCSAAVQLNIPTTTREV